MIPIQPTMQILWASFRVENGGKGGGSHLSMAFGHEAFFWLSDQSPESVESRFQGVGEVELAAR